MERHFYEQWPSGSNQHQNISSLKRSHSRSPARDAHAGRKHPGNENSPLSKIKKMKDTDFEKERRKIDLELQKREAKKKREEERINEVRRKQSEVISGITKSDLRFILEKTRGSGSKSITPPPVPPPILQKSKPTAISSSFLSVDPPEILHEIPGFDYNRLGSEPPSGEKCSLDVFRDHGSQVRDEKSDAKREELVRNFTEDCDTVALVTQMLIDENPALERPLVGALKGVFEKVMKKHLDLLPE